MLNFIKKFFSYKHFDFTRTTGIIVLLLSLKLFRDNLSFNEWYFIFIPYFLAYYGNRCCIIFSCVAFFLLSMLAIVTSYNSDSDFYLKLLSVLLIFAFFYRDMIFMYRYKKEHKQEVAKKYNNKFLLIGTGIIALLTIIWYISLETIGY